MKKIIIFFITFICILNTIFATDIYYPSNAVNFKGDFSVNDYKFDVKMFENLQKISDRIDTSETNSTYFKTPISSTKAQVNNLEVTNDVTIGHGLHDGYVTIRGALANGENVKASGIASHAEGYSSFDEINFTVTVSTNLEDWTESAYGGLDIGCKWFEVPTNIITYLTIGQSIEIYRWEANYGWTDMTIANIDYNRNMIYLDPYGYAYIRSSLFPPADWNNPPIDIGSTTFNIRMPTSEARGIASHTEGIDTLAFGTASHAEGLAAAAMDNDSYVWSGIRQKGRYSSHGQGTFNVNPANGTEGFYIGNYPISQYMAGTVEFSPRTISNSEIDFPYTINTSDPKQQYFKQAYPGGGINELILPPADTNKVGELTLYLTQIPILDFFYDISSNNIVGFPEEKPWLSIDSTNNSVWKFKFYSVPSQTNWWYTDSESFSTEPPQFTYTITTSGNLQGISPSNNISSFRIPSVINGIQVKTIGGPNYNQIFRTGCDDTLYIPEGVTSIAQNGLNGNEKVKHIILPSTLTSIGNGAFYRCYELLDIDLPESLKTIGQGGVFQNTKISKLIIPSRVTSIGYNAFNGLFLHTTNFINNSSLISPANNQNWGAIIYSGEQDGYYWDEQNNLLRVAPTVTEATNIPSNIINLGRAFNGNTNIINLIIPDQITKLDSESFRGCGNLQNIQMGNNITNIDTQAFLDCNSLTNTSIDNLLTWLNIHFYNNSANPVYYSHNLSINGEKLIDLIIPSGITNINNSAFAGCNLNSVYVENDITKIGDRVFNYCTNLTDVILGTNVTSLGVSAFSYCKSLTNISLGNINSINSYTFYQCSGLTDLVLPNTITNISSSAFEFCSNITNLILSSNINHISSSAFRNCSKLNKINIPNTLQSIDNNAFYGCSKLSGVYIDDLNSWNEISFNGSYANPVELSHRLYLNDEEIIDLVTPAGMTNINNYIFAGLTNLESILCNEDLLSIGNYAFNNCQNLNSITFSDNIETIGQNAFENCKALTSIEFPEALISIGDYAFNNCNNINSITMTNNVESIGNYAFNNCSALSTLSLSDNLRTIGDYAFNNCKISSIELPDSLETIGQYAFVGNPLTDVKFSENLTSIGNYAFNNCSTLNSVILSNNVESIGNYAFNECTSLTNATLSTNLTSIGEKAFYNCNLLEDIYIPDSVTSIGANAFNLCTNAKTLHISTNLTTIGNSVFYNCRNITDVEIPEGVTSLAWACFNTCSALTNAILPSTLKTIDQWVFTDSGIQSIVFPEGFTSLAKNGCRNCYSLKSITILGSTASFGADSFNGCSAVTTIYYNLMEGETTSEAETRLRNKLSGSRLPTLSSVTFIPLNNP